MQEKVFVINWIPYYISSKITKNKVGMVLGTKFGQNYAQCYEKKLAWSTGFFFHFFFFFSSLNESTCQTRKNVFYFTLKALFVCFFLSADFLYTCCFVIVSYFLTACIHRMNLVLFFLFVYFFASLTVQKRKLKALIWPPTHFVVNFNKFLNMNNWFLCIVTSENHNKQYLVSYFYTHIALLRVFLWKNLHTVVVNTFFD